jgi:hypothetical protein
LQVWSFTMSERQSYRRQIPLWQIAPFLLVPPALVAGVSLYWDLPLTPFVTTLALTWLTLLLLLVRRSDPRVVARQAPPSPSVRQPRVD